MPVEEAVELARRKTAASGEGDTGKISGRAVLRVGWEEINNLRQDIRDLRQDQRDIRTTLDLRDAKIEAASERMRSELKGVREEMRLRFQEIRRDIREFRSENRSFMRWFPGVIIGSVLAAVAGTAAAVAVINGRL